jgi:homoserine kinase
MLCALDKVCRCRVPRERLLEWAVELEGHPDNATPALYGGFVVAGRVGDSVRWFHFRVDPKLCLVTWVPRFEMPTEQARKLLPRHYERSAAAHALNRSALIVAAFASGNYSALRGLFDDRFQQPYREKVLPVLSRVIRAGEAAGAIGGWLSGSGSAIMCLTLGKQKAVASAMLAEAPDAEILFLRPDRHGAKCIPGAHGLQHGIGAQSNSSETGLGTVRRLTGLRAFPSVRP